MRGNLQTRIGKLEAGACDVLMLAYAGVTRMGYDELIVHQFDTRDFTPPVGQGCIAVEAAKTLAEEKRGLIRECLNNVESELCLRAERAFLRKLEGGCSIPAFGHAVLKEGSIELTAGLATLSGAVDDPEGVGSELGDFVLDNKGRETLAAIKAELSE